VVFADDQPEGQIVEAVIAGHDEARLRAGS
jgi:hypothetical protein